jgi:hypothetical protein
MRGNTVDMALLYCCHAKQNVPAMFGNYLKRSQCHTSLIHYRCNCLKFIMIDVETAVSCFT